MIEYLSAALTAAFGCSTLMTWLLYRRASRRIRDAEASTVELNAENLRIAALHDSLNTVNAQLHEALKAGARKDRIIEDKTKRIREKDEEIVALYKQLLQLKDLPAAEKI